MVDPSLVGRSLSPVTAHVEPGRLRYFRQTLGETNPVYGDAKTAQASGYPGTPVPPTYLFCLEMMDAEQSFEFLTVLGVDLARVLHGEQRFISLGLLAGVPVSVAHTESDDEIRIFSFRKATGREERRFFNEVQN